jgi:hypothetical protein
MLWSQRLLVHIEQVLHPHWTFKMGSSTAAVSTRRLSPVCRRNGDQAKNRREIAL